MDQNTEKKNYRNLLTAGTILVVLAIAVGAWLIGRSSKPANTTTPPAATSNSATGTDAKSLISYSLPDAWSENTCPAVAGTVYVIPNGTSLNCSANPSAPIKVFVDSQNTTDCQQLKPTDNQGIKKHVCISLYIDGHKSLKASTTRSSSSGDTTTSDYYINTGKGVVALEYTYSSSNDFQTGFDQLATSVKVKA